MGFVSFLGRVFFASLFILSAWQMFHEFGDNGGTAAKEIAPKVVSFQKLLSSKIGLGLPNVDVKHIVLISMAVKGLGGVLFVFSSPSGAYLLMYHLLFSTPVVYDFYNYKANDPNFHLLLAEFLQNVALFGALGFFVELKKLSPRKQLRKKPLKTKTT